MEFILWLGFYFLTIYAFLPAFVSRMFGFRVFSRGVTDNEIAITFDDGPDPVYTPQLLDLLKRYNAKCTFFVVGAHAEKYPEIIARIHREGHVIGIHNYQHYTNWLMRPKTVSKHIMKTSEVIEQITGVKPAFYRPPWGIVNLFDFRRIGHLQIVLWTGMFGDWKVRVGAEKLYQRMRRKLRPGEVFVLHDSGRTFGADEEAPANMIAALERILEDGREKGYRFVGVDEMVELTEKNKARKISRFRQMIISIWMLWEKAFHVAFRLKPIAGTSYHYRIRKYSGPAVTMKNGNTLRRGDYVLEFHFDNQKLHELGMSTRSTVQLAIRMIRDMEKGLPDIARVLEDDPKGGQVAAMYGVSLIHKGSEGMGFQTFDLPKGLFSWMTRNYLKFMLSIIHPDGGKRIREYGEHLTPKMILMERGDLLSWKDRSGRERPSRMERREAKTPALPLDHGASADQLGV
jgi:peptidoglycan/xylan/chitin deacetylase (PgdA/CDA1 family)